MKKIQWIALIALAVVICMQPAAFAKVVSGKVDGVDAGANTVSVSTVNPETNAEEKVSVSVKPETVFLGVAALGELSNGQEVSVEATEDAAGALSAVSVMAVPVVAAEVATQAAEAVSAVAAGAAEEAK